MLIEKGNSPTDLWWQGTLNMVWYFSIEMYVFPKVPTKHEIQSQHPSHCVRIIIWPVYLNRKYIRKRTELERGRGDCCNVPLSIVNFASTAVASSSAVLGGRPSSLRPPEAVAFSSLRPSVSLSVVMPHLLKLPPSFVGRTNSVARLPNSLEIQ